MLLKPYYVCDILNHRNKFPRMQRAKNYEKKLIIRPHRYGGETTVISLRFPKEMLAIIDQAARDTGRTRNEIVVLSMEFALEHMEITDK